MKCCQIIESTLLLLVRLALPQYDRGMYRATEIVEVMRVSRKIVSIERNHHLVLLQVAQEK